MDEHDVEVNNSQLGDTQKNKEIEDYLTQVKRIARIHFLALAITVLGWGFTPYSSFFLGIILGLSIGLVNILHMAFKIHKLGQSIVLQDGRRVGLGMVTRLSLAALGAIVAITYPEVFHIIGLVLGLFLPSVFALGDAIYFQIKNKT